MDLLNKQQDMQLRERWKTRHTVEVVSSMILGVHNLVVNSLAQDQLICGRNGSRHLVYLPQRDQEDNKKKTNV